MTAPLVFISYRSDDEPWAALFLRQELAARFGPTAVFLDSLSVQVGEDFRPVLLGAVARSSLMLVVMGRRWHAGHDANDWVRREITLAAMTGVRIVPVLVGEAELPDAATSPPEIGELAHRQYLRLRHRDSVRDIAQVVDSLTLIEPRLVTGAQDRKWPEEGHSSRHGMTSRARG